MKELTQKELKELLSYDEKTGKFKWRTTGKGRKNNLSDGCSKGKRYEMIQIKQRHYMSHRLAWLYVYGVFPENQIDHIDRNKLNNAIENLRDVTQSCNMRNAGLSKNNKSGVNGVWKPSGRNMWCASGYIKPNRISLGSFPTKEEAIAARLRFEKENGYINYREDM